MNHRFGACLLLILFTTVVSVPVAPPTASSRSEERVKISYCELKKDPAAYNHKLIEVTGFISHGFEDFTLFEPACSSYPEVWLEYGGTAASGTMYCCGPTSARSRPKPLVVENIPVELVADERFKQFDKLIQRRPDSIVRATIVGRFFAGQEVKYPRGTFRGGYGHMGCCSLLAIQQVLSVELQDSTELDYGAWAEQPDIKRRGCGYTFLTDIMPYNASLKTQAQADRGEQDWMFIDPKRVAAEGLAVLINADQSSIQLRQTGKMQGRFIYQWRPSAKSANGKSRNERKPTYMVVVSRPYWLSYYAKDPKRVAWVVLAAYESSCGGRNSVQRIR